jgi:hypothetical protein
MILVFGSNRKGIHGAGSAQVAFRRYGAEFGIGEGRTGNAYAIPTKETPYRGRSISDIRASVDLFLEYARAHPELEFAVVRVGCGLAGRTDEQMAPLFDSAPENCAFDPLWEKYGLTPWTEAP